VRPRVNVHEAKTNFSKIVLRVMAGERIIIAKAGVPIAELRPLSEQPKRRVPNRYAGKIWISPHFDDPLPEFEEYM